MCLIGRICNIKGFDGAVSGLDGKVAEIVASNIEENELILFVRLLDNNRIIKVSYCDVIVMSALSSVYFIEGWNKSELAYLNKRHPNPSINFEGG